MTRRHFLTFVPAPIAALVLAACGGEQSASPPQAAGGANGEPDEAAQPASQAATATGTPNNQAQLSPTPACGDDDDPTPSQTEGPYFTPNSPERASLLEGGISGTKLVLAGAVFNTNCQPIARALVDFWQCDNAGNYDNSGYRLRGHQFTDANGRYRLETIVPGLYPGRTRHIHVKVQAPNRPLLTTQLYFPTDEARNRQDGIFSAALVIEDYKDAGADRAGNFNFVLNV